MGIPKANMKIKGIINAGIPFPCFFLAKIPDPFNPYFRIVRTSFTVLSLSFPLPHLGPSISKIDLPEKL